LRDQLAHFTREVQLAAGLVPFARTSGVKCRPSVIIEQSRKGSIYAFRTEDGYTSATPLPTAPGSFPEEIAGKVRVKGRGGTVLQAGVDLIERAPDFPADGPILIITDAGCDVVRVRPSIGTASDLR